MQITRMESEPRNIGAYQVLASIEKGGMGEVLLARRSGLHGFEKLVAIKVIRSDHLDKLNMRAMFLDEARLVARLDHPAITQVHDFGEQNNMLYLVMEYVPGISFVELMALGPPPVVVLRAMIEVCYGLHAAHELCDLTGQALNVVHRDVSPDNLLLTFDGRVKILDFGIALMRGRQTPRTEFGRIKGKPAYMAPEQLDNRTIDRRTDIFSAAVVLHELLTGQRLFVGESVFAIGRAIETMVIPPPSTLNPDLPQALDATVMRGLRREPEQRYQTALEMAQALEDRAAWMGGESLVNYSQRALTAARLTHLDWLHQATSELPGDQTEKPVGRAGHVNTAPMQKPLQEEERPAPPMRTNRRWLPLFLLLLLAAGSLGVLAIFRPSPQSPADKREPPTVVSPSVPLPETAPEPVPVAETPAPAVEPSQRQPNRIPDHDTIKHRPRPRRGKDSKRQPTGPAADRTQKAARGFGRLTVGSTPYAMVMIDGKQVGMTPIIELRLEAGTHEVVLMSPDTHQVRLRRRIEVRENGFEEIVIP